VHGYRRDRGGRPLCRLEILTNVYAVPIGIREDEASEPKVGIANCLDDLDPVDLAVCIQGAGVFNHQMRDVLGRARWLSSTDSCSSAASFSKMANPTGDPFSKTFSKPRIRE
jgi:hypothetical protein